MRRPGQVLVALGGLLALASALMHGFFARPAVLARLPADTAPETVAALNAAWILGTAAMAAFGLIALLGLRGLGRGPAAGVAIVVAGLFFLAYGGWAWSYRHHAHFTGFMVTGALLLAGGLLASRERRPM